MEGAKEALEGKLAEIGDIVECAKAAAKNHLEEIADVVHAKAHDDDDSEEE